MINDQQLEMHIRQICRYHPWYSRFLRVGQHYSALAELPLMTADILDRYYYTQQGRPEPGLSVYRTSGTSTGIRKAIYYSEADDEHYIRCKAASFRHWLGNSITNDEIADRPMLGRPTEKNVSPPIRRALADMGTGHAAHTALTIFERLGLQGEALSFTAPIEEHIAKLESYRPDLLYTMPSILDAIAAHCPQVKQLGIRKIIVVGEIATLEWQANMAARFGIAATDILDTYGSIEIGAIAAYSHEHSRYILADGLYGEALRAEEIDPRFEPLQRNERVLVLTSTIRTLFPALRYVTYDVVRDFETIEIDGQMKQTFTCISKRIGAELKHGEKISLYDIEEVVHRHLKDADLRVKLQNNQLIVQLQSQSLNDEKLSIIRHELEHAISDIGEMIRNRLLNGITVTRIADGQPFVREAVKVKKIYRG